jgi:XTP/dITP diphosphohydrolase
MDHWSGKKFVVATGNRGKLREIRALTDGLGIEVVPQSEFAVPEVDETACTFVENAILKARQAARYSGLPALADDSGLEVDFLQGAPGVRSARYGGSGAGDQANNDKLLQALEGVPEARRGARFRCVMVFLRHPEDPSPLIGQGVWEGRILSRSRGSGGFGYDPVFWVPELGCSVAELSPVDKNRLSHRGLALQSLFGQLLDMAVPCGEKGG